MAVLVNDSIASFYNQCLGEGGGGNETVMPFSGTYQYLCGRCGAELCSSMYIHIHRIKIGREHGFD